MKKIIKNFSLLIIAQAFYKIFSLVSFILLARHLGINAFGLLSYVISFIYLFDFLTDCGISVTMVREVAGEIEEKLQLYVNNIITLKIGLSIVVYILIIMVLVMLRESRQVVILILLLTASLILDSYSTTMRSIFNIFEKMSKTAISTLLEGLLKFTFVIIFILFLGDDLKSIISLFLLTSIIIFSFNVFLVRRNFIKFNFSFDFQLWTKLLKLSIPVAFLALFQTLNFRIDVIMLSRMTNNTFTGIFAAGSRLIEPILIIPFTFSMAILPTISRFAKTSRSDFIKSYRNSLLMLLAFSVPIALLLYLTAKRLIVFLLGTEFADSFIVVRILSLMLIPFFFRPTMEYFALVIKKYHIIYFVGIAGLCINIFLNYIFIPSANYRGCCFATLCAESFIAISLFLLIRNELRRGKQVI